MANYPKKTSSLLLATEGVLCHWKVHVLRALRAAFVANVFGVASEQPGLKLRLPPRRVGDTSWFIGLCFKVV